MNLRVIGFISAAIGLGTGVPSLFMHDIATMMSGAGACVMAVVLYQQQDFKERLIRIEDYIMDSKPKSKGHHA